MLITNGNADDCVDYDADAGIWSCCVMIALLIAIIEIAYARASLAFSAE